MERCLRACTCRWKARLPKLHARTATVLRADSGRRMRSDDAARLERSSRLQNVQRVTPNRISSSSLGLFTTRNTDSTHDKWTVRPLTEQEKNELLQGPADLRAKQASDFEFIMQTVAAISDPRLARIGRSFRQRMGRPISSHRRSAQISSRPARRTGRAHRANDAHSQGDRAALSCS